MLKRRSGPIRVLVVEDSPTARDLLVALFSQSPDIQVVGTALDGEEAVARTAQLRPDVITMDIHMPRMNGLEATRRIMKATPTPIVMVTASVNRPDMDLTFEALRVGALTIVKKPSLNDETMCAQVVQTVRLMADVPVVHRWSKTGPLTPLSPMLTSSQPPTASTMPYPPLSTNQNGLGKIAPTGDIRARRAIVGIASSTGGPSALVTALKPLPADFSLPILVVQHITRGFAVSLAEWLNKELSLNVHVAAQGETPLPGNVLIAPDDVHMQVSDRGTILLHSSPPYKGLRPSANYLFFSMARVYGRQATGIILTGMGDDGVEGLMGLHDQGALTIAQDEATSVVYGMPREAVLHRAIDYVLPIERVGAALLQMPSVPVEAKPANI